MSEAGRQQLLPNVLASWLAYAAATIIGFVMPRLVLDSVGQEVLGVWDLCWSFLAYISFTGIGMGSAVDHFTARLKDHELAPRLPGVIATGFYMQLAFALVVAALFCLVLIAIPFLFSSFGSVSSQVVLSLAGLVALTVVVLLLGEIAQGILTGSHQSRKTEIINVVHDVSLAAGMIVVLANGYGIVGLAWTTLLIRCATEAVRFAVAFTAVSGCSLSAARISGDTGREMALFATKSSLFGFQELLVYQSVRVAFFIGAGPAAFAAFSRYSTLARQINRLTDRLTLSVPALTSGLSAQGDAQRIHDVYAYGAQAVLMVALPTLSIFAVFGDPIVALWMGPDFVVPGIAWTFCAACVLHAHYSMSAKVLRGINSHGKISLYCLCASAALLMLFYWVQPPTSAEHAAWQIAATMLLAVHIPHIVFAARKMGFSSFSQIQDIYLKPLIYNTIFLILLGASKSLLGTGQGYLATFVAAAGITGLVAAYWYSVCDIRMRNKLRSSLQDVIAGGV